MPDYFDLAIYGCIGIVFTTGGLLVFYYLDQIRQTVEIKAEKEKQDCEPISYTYRGWVVNVRYKISEHYPFNGGWVARATKNGNMARRPQEMVTDLCKTKAESIEIINQEIMRIERM